MIPGAMLEPTSEFLADARRAQLRTGVSSSPGRGSTDRHPSATWDEALPSAGVSAGDVLADRYELEHLLGQGAMGVVYRARDRVLGRRVAVKVLKIEWREDDAGACVQREAVAMSAQNHPHVVSVFDANMDHQPPFFVMEYLPGLNVAELLRRGEKPPWPWIREIMLQILAGLEAVHAQGIVHRDIKPSNCQCVDFASFAEPPHVKILDFGVAYLGQGESPGLDATSAIGTSLYCSPEQALEDPVDGRSDLYSAGVVLYELLTGQTPFFGSSRVDVLMQHIHEPPPPLPEGLRAPAGLVAVLERALAKKPEDRFPTAAAFAQALREVSRSPSDGVATGEGLPELEIAERSEAQALLDRVRRYWIDEVLARIEVSSGLLKPPLSLASELVTGGGASQTRPGELMGEPLPAVFEQLGRSLLLLGEPGSGKTVAALVLARYLAHRASREGGPLPVVFNLGGFRGQPPDLAAWLVEQLGTHYQVPQRLASLWLAERRIAPILDGLDESADPATTIAAINRFVAASRPHAIIVSARADVYVAQGERLALENAVRLDALSPEQVGRSTAHDPALSEALRGDHELAELARSPLMLGLMHRVAATGGPAAFSGADSKDVAARVYERYLESLGRKAAMVEGPAFSRMSEGLSRLAARMLTQGEAIFRFETLQPPWLPAMGWRYAFFGLSRVFIACLFTLSFAPAIAYTPLDNAGLQADLGFAVRLCATVGLLVGLTLAGLSSAFPKSAGGRWRGVISTVALLAASAVAGSWIASGTHPVAIVMAIELGVFSAALFVVGRSSPEIRTVHPSRWKWAELGRRWPIVLGAAVSFAALAFVFTTEGRLRASLGFGLVVGTLGAAIIGHRPAIPDLDTPASGIRATAGAALKWGLLGFGASATLFGILYTPFYGACVGLAVGTFTALRFGGFDIWSHFVLRGLLRWVGEVPPGVGAILAKAVRLGMLRQLGGGYMFAHRSLQQVLAKRSPTFVKE